MDEKLEIKSQTIEYIQAKAETTESKFYEYQSSINDLLKTILQLFVVLRDSRTLPVPDEYVSLFIGILKKWDIELKSRMGTPSKQPNVQSPKSKCHDYGGY